MATYYVDPAASGLDDGTSWANAWTTLQRAIDGTGGTQPVAGDIVYCRGAETVSAMIESDGIAGTTTQFVRYIGCNASGVVDGTRYVLDASNNTLTGVLRLVSDYICFEHIEIANCTGHGIYVAGYAGCDANYFVNLYVHDNTGAGVSCGSSSLNSPTFLKSRIEDNGTYGVFNVRTAYFFDCSIKGNGNDGIRTQSFGASYLAIVGCAITGNGGNGVWYYNTPGCMYGSVIDGNTGDGIECDRHLVLHSTRITENGVGIDADGPAVLSHVYMPDTSQDRDNTTKFTGDVIEYLSTCDLSGTDSGGGYTNAVGGDFTLASGASLRDEEIDLDGTNSIFVAAGFHPSAAGGGGGSTVIVVED